MLQRINHTRLTGERCNGLAIDEDRPAMIIDRRDRESCVTDDTHGINPVDHGGASA